jgi:hypothetical protein
MEENIEILQELRERIDEFIERENIMKEITEKTTRYLNKCLNEMVRRKERCKKENDRRL